MMKKSAILSLAVVLLATQVLAFEQEDLDSLLKTRQCYFCKLQGANLEGRYLDNANLSLARLNGAKLRNATLRNANLENADLSDANLEGAVLRGAILDFANLKGAIFCNTILPSGDPSMKDC